MKTITVNVSEPIYREFQEYARRHDCTTAELIRAAMEEYRQRWSMRRGSVRAFIPLDLGATKAPLTQDNLLDEMLP